MVAFLVFCIVVLLLVLTFVFLCMSKSEEKCNSLIAEVDGLERTIAILTKERNRWQYESKRDRESLDYFRAQVEKLNHDFKSYQGGQ